MIKLTLLYDGLCPICSREMRYMRMRPGAEQIDFVDYNHSDLSQWGLSATEVAKEIHAVTVEQKILKGVSVFSALYRLVGLGWLANLLDCTILRPFFNLSYRIFAKNRILIGRVLQATLFSSQSRIESKITSCPCDPGCKPSSESKVESGDSK